MVPSKAKRGRGFSLLELVIVVVIIAIIAAIAVPRLSRGTAGAADSALKGDLAVLRNALDLYNAEHNGSYPAVATFVEQLTTYTDAAGAAQATRDTTHIYGPYIRNIPALPLSREKEQLERLRKTLVAYRMVLGQPRQEDLLNYLQRRCEDEHALNELMKYRIDLSPP